jgi:uncharacterized protein (DUF1800 family)
MNSIRIDAGLEPFRPGVDGEFDFAAAAHLAQRCELGASPARIESLRRLGPAKAVAEILAAPSDEGAYARTLAMGPRVARRGELRNLQAWWLRRFLVADRPFREHLALFWHDHFATSQRKVQDLVAMQLQNRRFLDLGSGRFPELLEALARDPAMLIWLDNAESTRAHPNENFARELFELFSLGHGAYGENDVREAARAFTGWQVRSGRFYFNAAEHDSDVKRILGQRGPMGGEEVLKLACALPAGHRFIATKLARWFVCDTLTPELEVALGDLFERLDRDVGAFMSHLFRSRLFFSAASRRCLVRSPVQYLVGALRSIGARVDTVRLALLAENLGQSLFQPPSVEGWKGGLHWIDSAAMVGRQNFGVECAQGIEGSLKCRVADGVELDLAARELLWSALSGAPLKASDRKALASLAPARAKDPRQVLALWLQGPEAQLF